MSDKLDKAIQAKQREKLETEKRLLEKKGLKAFFIGRPSIEKVTI